MTGRLTKFVMIAAVLTLAACDKKPAPPPPPPPAPGAPAVLIKALDEMPSLPKPYDDAATPEAVKLAVDQAFERAKVSGKRVIVDMGGNWCSWCRGLAGVMNLPEVKPFIDQHFEVVYVPTASKQGETDLNLETVHRFGLTKVDKVPWLVIAEPDGTVVSSSYEVTEKDNETPQAMVNWLARWAKPAVPAKGKA